jgi:tetratricopeptide (TPR) repeat protein
LDATGWANAAWEAFMAGEFALCAEFAARALALEPRHFLGLYMRLEALFGLGQEAEALAACEELRQAHPTAHNAYEKLALLRALEQKLDEARPLAERAVELGSFCPTAWAAQGYVYFLAGRRDDAQASLEAAWKRADLDRRRSSNIYWWLLSFLRADAPETVAARRQQAASEAKTPLAQRQLALADAVLKP